MEPHLFIAGSPYPVHRYREIINDTLVRFPGPVDVLGWTRINGWHIRVLYVPASNFYSAFAGHFVFVWTVGLHTYAVGFHDVVNEQATLEWDRALVSSIHLVRP